MIQNTQDRPSVLVVLTSHGELGDTGKSTGFHLAELTHVLDVLERRNIHYELASVDGGRPPMDAKDRDDEVNARMLDDAVFQQRLEGTRPLTEYGGGWDAIYFPGGHGTMWDLPGNPDVARLVRGVSEGGGIVAAICHGPAAFVGLEDADGNSLVKGRRITCFSDEEERSVELDDVVPFLLQSKLEEEGAQVEPTDPGEPKVIADGHLITGQNPASATLLGEAIAQALAQVAR